MFGSRSTEKFAFVSRQLSHLSAELDIESAVKKLRSVCPEQYAAEIGYLDGLLKGEVVRGPDRGPTPFRILSQLVKEVPGNKTPLFRGFVEYFRQSSIVFETYWAGVVSMTWYFAMLSAIMIVVSCVFAFMTVPAFEELFSEFGSELPELTAIVFDFGGFGIPVFALMVAVIVGTLIWFVVVFHRKIQELEPFPNWPTWVPLVGRVSAFYNHGLMLNFSRLLIDAGRAPEDAIRIAARETGQSDWLLQRDVFSEADELAGWGDRNELAIAASTGTLKEEIQHQCEAHFGRLSLVLIDARDRFALFLKIVIYSFVLTIVVAMYLPIFKLGSIV